MRCYFIVVAVGLIACDKLHPCAQLACSDAVRVQVVPPLDPPGHYRVELVTDSTREHCELTLPDAKLRSGWQPCSAHVDVKEIDDRITHISVRAAPTQLELRISSSDGTLRDLEATPSYRIDRPNGEHCEPSCRVAEAVLGEGRD